MALPADTLSTPDQQRQQCVLPAHQQPPQPQLQPQQPAACTQATRPHRVRRCSFPPVSSAGGAAAATTPRIPQPPARALSPIASAPSLATLPLAHLASPPPKPRRQQQEQEQQQQQDTGSARAWRRRRSLYASGSCKSSPELCSWGHRPGPDQGARPLSPQQAQHSPGSGEPASGSDSGSGCEADLSHLLALQAAAVEAATLQLLSPGADTTGGQLGPALDQDDRSRQLQQALEEARAAQHGLQGQCAMLHDAVCQLQQEKERLQQQLADLESKFTLLSDSGSHRESSRAARSDGSATAPAAAAAAAAAVAGPGLQQQQQQPHLACLLAQLREAQAEVDALVAAELASQKEALLLQQQQRRQLQQHPGAAGAAAAAVATSPGAVDKAAALQAQLAQAHQHQQDLNAELLQLPAAGEGMALLCKIQSIKQQLQACRQQIAEHRSLGQQLAAAAAAAADAVPAAGCGSTTPPPARVLLLQQDSHGSLLSVLGCAGGPRLSGAGTVVAARDDCLGLSSPLAANEQLQLQLGDEPQTRRVRFASKLPLLLVSPAAPQAPAHELPAAGSSTAELPAASLQQPASARRRPAPPPKVTAVQPQSARQRLLKHSHQHNALAAAAAAAAARPEAPVALAADGSSSHTASQVTRSKAAGSNGGISTSGSGGAPCLPDSSLQLPGQELGSSFKPWSLQQQQQSVPGQYAVVPRPRSCRFRNEGHCPSSFDRAASIPAFGGGSATTCRQLSPLLLPGRSQAASSGCGAGAGQLLLPYEQLLVSPVRSASTGVATSSGNGPFTPGSSTARGLSLDGSLGLGLAGRDGRMGIDGRGCCRICRLVPAPPPASEQPGGGFGRSLSRGRVLQRRRSCSCLCMV